MLRGGGGGAPVDEDPAVTRAKEDASAALHAHAGTAVVSRNDCLALHSLL